jgi:glycosyltransferase involved in cell wall biosynthesis
MKHALVLIKDMVLNLLLGWRYDFFYISEARDWVIDEEGRTILESLRRMGHMRGRMTATPFGLRGKVLHFGSIGTLLTAKGLKPFHLSNKAIVSWFHVVDGDTRLRFAPLLNQSVRIVHTASENTKEKLIKAGIAASNIIVIPLGVDPNIFHPPTVEEKAEIRASLGIPDDAIVVGSFQKDGDGWGEGMTPKLIKGPDIFCDVVAILARTYPVYVLLTGPARGYVKKRLEEHTIPYSHVYLDHAKDVARYYRALDLYLICSREEGGPKALLESMASGVPVISTRVGMSIDVIKDGSNGRIVDTDPLVISRAAADSIDNEVDRKRMIAAALQTMETFHATALAEQFYFRIYKDML